MKRLMLAGGLLLLSLSFSHAAGKTPMIMGDYDAEPRLANGHVDNALLLQRLQQMNANTYFYLIWHAATDWEDLQAFLPMAAKANINVWVYLCPPSESGGIWPYSEPYRLDFKRWGEEIGKLSLRYPNLVGWVIDDFGADNLKPGIFTPESIKAFVQAGKKVNPKLKFYPLLYYGGITHRITDMLGPLVDGAVGAYPKNKREIESALKCLNDDYRVPGGCTIEFPTATPSRSGDFAVLSQMATVTEPATATISFRYQDDYNGPTEGYHVMQLRVDNKVVWQEDVAGKDNRKATVDLRQYVEGKRNVKISLGVWDLKGVGYYPILVTFSDLRIKGLEMDNSSLGYASGWKMDSKGEFALQCHTPQSGRHAYRLPLIVMPAGSRSEYVGRYSDGATTEHIAARIKQALELGKEGKVEGVVIYCLDKTAQGQDIEAVSELFRAYGSGK